MPAAHAEHGLHLHCCWESAPGQGESPELVEIWELRDFATYTAFVAASHGTGRDPRLRAWQRLRADWVASGDSMLCLPHPVSPTIAELKERGVKAKLVLLYSPWNNRRAIKIQGMGPEWDDLRPWSTDYGEHNADFAMWMKMAPALRDDCNDGFLVPAPFSTAR